jgi:hypothetical protein
MTTLATETTRDETLADLQEYIEGLEALCSRLMADLEVAHHVRDALQQQYDDLRREYHALAHSKPEPLPCLACAEWKARLTRYVVHVRKLRAYCHRLEAQVAVQVKKDALRRSAARYDALMLAGVGHAESVPLLREEGGGR